MEKLVRPVFTLELNCKILPGLVTIGKYDGTHPCITAATNADKIVIHSPHRRNSMVAGRIVWSESNKEIATLNINQPVSCLCAGSLLADDDKDILVIGTGTHILAYHVHDNKDIFYKECPDGVKSLAIGTFRDVKNGVIMVGGNSSVHGFDHTGNEIFWTAVGDVVTAMVLMDYNKDGMNELIVSSEDYYIRVFKGDQVVAEHLETEVVTNLTSLPENRLAYSVSNGTVGVYEQDVRLWRVKSKHFGISLQSYDLLGQSSLQLITCWSNGKIDCRSIITGEVLFKDSMSTGAAGLVEGDYRSIGKTDIICVSTDGEVRGYTTTKIFSPDISGEDQQNIISELLSQKQSLLMELKHYENNTNFNENVVNHTESYENSGVIPANTRLQIAITTNENAEKPHVEIYISTNNKTIIKSVIIFAEGIFKGETHVVHPPVGQLASEMSVPLYLPKDNPVDIHIKALIGYPKSIQFHVFEITRQLPRFSMYSLQEHSPQDKPEDFVEFRINERLQRICLWINQNFLFPSDIEFEAGPNLTLNLKCLRDKTNLIIIFEISGKVTICTSNLTLASDLIQSLAAYLNLDNLESVASFTKEEENLKSLMQKLSDIEDARMRLGTDVADRLGQIRNLVIRAEDSRLNDIIIEIFVNRNKPAVLLMHGLFGSAENFVISGPGHALAFYLADNGYDVWVGNARGTYHSRKHINLDPDRDEKFWHFSWHEIGVYDLPAQIDYIRNATNQNKIHYIGHLQGTTSFFVMASVRPEYNSRIKFMGALAPAAFITHIPSPGLKITGLPGVIDFNSSSSTLFQFSNEIANKEMPAFYKELNIVNKELINGYNIKLHNFNEGVETMKNINSIIQKASRLRVGSKTATIVNHCRNAIKNNNIDGLLKIIRTGDL